MTSPIGLLALSVGRAGGTAAMRAAGGGGAMLSCGAFEVLEPAFAPTPTPDPHYLCSACGWLST